MMILKFCFWLFVMLFAQLLFSKLPNYLIALLFSIKRITVYSPSCIYHIISSFRADKFIGGTLKNSSGGE